MATKIYGYSDDLIEIEGEIVNDEHGEYGTDKFAITCSDGTKAKITYDGDWHIVVTKEGLLFDKVKPRGSHDADYSDVLWLKDGIEWVKIGRKKYK
jgi:hypothetical protein